VGGLYKGSNSVLYKSMPRRFVCVCVCF